MKVPLSAEEMQERFPQFEILECLGRGGMGVVYKARQKALDRVVAIKVLAGERQGDVDFSRRFEREAKLLAQMSHANIVTVHDFGEADGLYYIVMEHVDGVNLRDLLQDGKMDPKQALAIVPPVCEALQYAHDRGVVHRDIKPENLLLDREGRVKIADFGIATLVGTDADRSGTPPYMAPEQQAAKGSVDHRADIYALGVVFYEMLTGERPEQDPSRPSQRVEIDVRLDEIVLRALEKEPARRYQTASEFRTVVETVATKAPTEEPPSSRKVRPPAAAPVQAARFSRTAIGGAFWASLFFLVVFLKFIGEGSGAVSSQSFVAGVWHLLGAILVIAGFTAPFGTTILGSVALTQIRRSAGRLYGLGLALFDVLLFPLLALDALIGGFWLLLIRALGQWTLGDAQPNMVIFWLLPTLVTAIIVDIMIIRWAWRAANKPVGNEVPGDATPETTAPRQRRMKFGLIIGVFIAAVAALLFWAQQPRMIDERTIAADSPDEMFSAMGQTWHSMRIMGGDRTFYRFIVQGHAGAVFESWEVPVPTEKLATSYVALSLDEVLFGKHGKIVWSDDGKRASFQVKGIEVAGFDTESGKPTGPEEDQATGERVPPRFTEWQGYTLHDLESGRKDGCLNLSRGHMDTLTEERWCTEGADALLTVEFASGKMDLAIGGATEFLLVEVGRDVARDPQRVVQLLLDSAGMKPEDGHEVIENEGGVFHILPGDGKGRTYAYAVAMPHGLPVAGLIEIGEADHAAETLRIRHRGLEIVEANLPAKTLRIREGILTTNVLVEDARALTLSQRAPAEAISGRKHSIGIHRVTSSPNGYDSPLADLALADEPLIDQDDIFSYDWESHTIRLKTQAAADRVLHRKEPDGRSSVGGSFVVVVDGQRIYRGALVSVASSIIPDAPIIHVGSAAGQWQPAFAIRIYPPTRGAPDLRGNPRLKQALAALSLMPADAPSAAETVPRVLRATPPSFANDVEPSLDRLTVTFDRPMMDKSWSFTAGDQAFSNSTGAIFPQRTGEIFYDAARTTCTMPVRLQPGRVYWVGINSPQFQNFKSENGLPAPPYQVVFATRSADGTPTPLPDELVRLARHARARSPDVTAPPETSAAAHGDQ